MHMHMLWRRDAAVAWIDIRHKVTGGSRFVNDLSSLSKSIPSMRRSWGLVIPRSHVWPGDEESAGARPETADSSEPVSSGSLGMTRAYFSNGRRSVTESCCG